MLKENAAILLSKLNEAVPASKTKEKVGLFFSGGIDSAVVGALLKAKNYEIYAITVGFENSKDILMSKMMENYFDKHYIIKINEKELQNQFKKVIALTKKVDPITVIVGTVIYLAAKKANELKLKVVFTGAGSDEIFAGYDSHAKALEKGETFVEEECRRRLKTMQSDLKRDNIICAKFKLACKSPFIDKNIIEYSMTIPTAYKIAPTVKKIILREVAKLQGLPQAIVSRPKKAAQYGTNLMDKAKKFAKKKGFATLTEYLKTLKPKNAKNAKKI